MKIILILLVSSNMIVFANADILLMKVNKFKQIADFYLIEFFTIADSGYINMQEMIDLLSSEENIPKITYNKNKQCIIRIADKYFAATEDVFLLNLDVGYDVAIKEIHKESKTTTTFSRTLNLFDDDLFSLNYKYTKNHNDNFISMTSLTNGNLGELFFLWSGHQNVAINYSLRLCRH